MDDSTAKFLPSPAGGGSPRRSTERGGASRVHKPTLDEMGIALHHEVAPHRSSSPQRGPRKPALDEMGPGVESAPAKKENGPRSTLGRPGMRGGWKPRRR